MCRLGAEWQRIRTILNPRMLKPKHVSGYTNAINAVVKDFIEKVAWLRAAKGNGEMVPDIAGELYKFAFEGETLGITNYRQNNRGRNLLGLCVPLVPLVGKVTANQFKLL